MIQNPVLTGFHADPSMICVDGTFYVANSAPITLTCREMWNLPAFGLPA